MYPELVLNQGSTLLSLIRDQRSSKVCFLWLFNVGSSHHKGYLKAVDGDQDMDLHCD